MSQLQRTKQVFNTITNVIRKKNNLIFYSANNTMIPHKIITLNNLKSVVILDNIQAERYITCFKYKNDNTSDERVEWVYAFYEDNWKDETHQLINKMTELL
jgi:hypothetical protein